MNKEKRKLFRMTTKRQIVLSDIIFSINIRLTSFEEDGLSRQLILHTESLNEDERKQKLEEVEEKRKHFALIHDVLEIYNCRDWLYKREFLMKEKRDWENEYDIPLVVYNQAIQDAIEQLTWYHESPIVRKTQKREQEYQRNVEMLSLMQRHRNEQE